MSIVLSLKITGKAFSCESNVVSEDCIPKHLLNITFLYEINGYLYDGSASFNSGTLLLTCFEELETTALSVSSRL